jgi:tetratricopeptide (TPR) repeat protein
VNRRIRRIREEYVRDRDVVKLVASLEAMRDGGEDFFLVFLSLGAGYMGQQRFDDALEAFRHAIDRNPDSSFVMYQVGRILARQGKHDDAVVHYTRAFDLDASDSKPAADLGVSLLVLGRVPEAIKAFERALAVDPADAVARRGLAQAMALEAMPPDERPTVALDASVPLVMPSKDARWSGVLLAYAMRLLRRRVSTGPRAR